MIAEIVGDLTNPNVIAPQVGVKARVGLALAIDAAAVVTFALPTVQGMHLTQPSTTADAARGRCHHTLRSPLKVR